ncbi:hypothetical protein LEMLEM_LOCUS23415 [Lemmus lemmus]
MELPVDHQDCESPPSHDRMLIGPVICDEKSF